MRQARMTSLGQVRLYKKHRVNGLTRRNPLLGLLRRCGRLVVDAPGAVRGGESTTQWLCHLAALRGHLEAAKRFGTWCP